MSLNAIAGPAVREPGPRVIFVRCRTVAKVDSIGFGVRRWIQCSAGQDRPRGEVVSVGETPFPRGPPPNHAGPFPGTWLSSDLCRVRDGVGVDDVVAGGADHEGLASLGCHERCPRGLAGPDRP